MTKPALACRRMRDTDQNPAVGHPTAIRVPQVRTSPVEGEGRVLGHTTLHVTDFGAELTLPVCSH